MWQIIFLLCGMLRVSKVIRFLSHPVMTGFTSGAAFYIGFSQLK
jgi:SulP family sulfate permease